MGKRIKISSYVESELQMLREKCNFNESELAYFNAKAKGKSNIEIAMDMHVSESTVSSLARKVRYKISKVS